MKYTVGRLSLIDLIDLKLGLIDKKCQWVKNVVQ